MSQPMDRYYSILQLQPGSSPAEVKRAYRLLARQWHPDRFQDPAQKAQAEAKFKELNQAYEALKGYVPPKSPPKSDFKPEPPPKPPPEPKPEPKPKPKPDPTAGKSVAELRSQAERLTQDGDYEGAIAYLSSLLKRYPNDATIYRQRGQLRSQLGFHRSANADLVKAMQLEYQRPSDSSTPAAMPPDCDQELTPSTSPFLTHTQISALAVRADCSLLITGSRTGRLQLWHAQSGRLYQTIEAHLGVVTGLVSLDRGRWLVSSGADGQIKLWRCYASWGWWRAKLVCRQTIVASNLAVNTLASDRQAIYSTGEDGRLQRWRWRWFWSRLDKIAVLVGMADHRRHNPAATALQFSPTGDRLAIGDAQGWIQIWRRDLTRDLTSNLDQVLQRLPAHRGSVRSIAWSPDGAWLVSTGDDQVMRLWDVRSGELVAVQSNIMGQVFALPNPQRFEWIVGDRQGLVQTYGAT